MIKNKMKWKEIKSDIRERGHVNLIFFIFLLIKKKKEKEDMRKLDFFVGVQPRMEEPLVFEIYKKKDHWFDNYILP